MSDQPTFWSRLADDGPDKAKTPPPLAHPTVVHMLADAITKAPEREALVLGDERLTYAEYGRCAAGLAAELSGLGLSGERVAIVMGNSLDTAIAYFGIHAAGAQIVPLNPAYTARELQQILEDAEVNAILFDVSRAGNVGPVADDLDIPFRIAVGDGERRLTDWRDGDGMEHQLPLPDPDSLATLQFTGGTTGRSKGVQLTHRAIACNIQQREALTPARMDVERILCVMPLFHVYASHICLQTMVYARGTMVVLPQYHPATTLAALADEKITIFAGSPTIFSSLLSFDGFAAADLSSIYFCYSGSAALPGPLLERWEKETGTPILEGFGQSEAGPVLTYNPLDGLRKVGSVGIAVPDTDVQIVDLETGRTVLPMGGVGEIRARGPQIMIGYRNRPDETAEALRDGWLYTGDIGEFDEDGYLYIRDRKKEMVIVSGYNVFPREVEDVLYTHTAVREAAVIGEPDNYRGERLVAIVALRGLDADDTEDDVQKSLIAHCEQSLAHYKVPKVFRLMPELPKTSVGKIDKKALKP